MMPMCAPRLLAATHKLAEFDCGQAELNDWLQNIARQAHGSGSAKTFVVVGAQENVIGYYSLAVGNVANLYVPERIRKGMGRHPVPVMLLARLAVSVLHQGRGIGTGLLKDAIRRTLLASEHAGIRAMLVHPIDDDAAHFYASHGFEASPMRAQQMLLLLKDAKRLLSGA